MSLQPHIRISETESARYAILPGDPMRVERVAAYLDQVENLAFNREHKSVRGLYKGIPILVVSTGMGGASAGIAIEELHRIGVKNMIRIGSCGALQPGIELGDLILLNGAVRDEGTSKAYIDAIFPAVPDTELLMATLAAAKDLDVSYHIGIGRSHDSFYTDQEEDIDRYWSQKGVLGSDMETAALFTIGQLRGIKTASILNTVALYEGQLAEDINGYVDLESRVALGEKHEILTALEAIYRMETKEKKNEMEK
ncbi:nucleoside phosphorylase [Streptococcus cameli]